MPHHLADSPNTKFKDFSMSFVEHVILRIFKGPIVLMVMT